MVGKDVDGTTKLPVNACALTNWTFKMPIIKNSKKYFFTTLILM
jgi:hypothetical protein